MKANRIINIQCIHILTIPMIIVLAIPGFALNIDTHRAVNIHIVDPTSGFPGYSLDKYLKNNLGISDGVTSKFYSGMVQYWISDGGEYEDEPPGCVPYWRSRNHFHNPIDNSGFSGIWDTGLFSGMSAIDWAMQPLNSQSCGCYSWNDVRDYYYRALTSPDKRTREINFAGTFRGLGQLMHLVQDMSVPDHVRNNSHYFAYDYEKWADNPTNRGPLTGYSVRCYEPDSSYPLNLKNLFDTEQYNGTNPDITLNGNTGLSEYTSANFLSPDSIFNNPNIPYPAYSQTELNKLATGNLYLTKRGYGEANGSGERINYLARAQTLYNFLPADYKRWALTVKDPLVQQEYASKLIPRAIGYSSQVLSYFFRGQLDVEWDGGNMEVKNASTETIAGDDADSSRFELFYDTYNGVRWPFANIKANTLAPGEKQIISFSPPAGAVPYILVYRGKLGDEPNALIGKYMGGDYWEPWNGPNVNSRNPWEIYNWPGSGNGATWEITADPLAPEERPKVLHFHVTGGYPYGNYSLLATNGGMGDIVPLDKPIPIDSKKKLYFNIRSLKSGSGIGYGDLFVVDSNGIRKQWYFNDYEQYQSAPLSNHPVWIGDNDGTVGLDLSPLSDSIIYFAARGSGCFRRDS